MCSHRFLAVSLLTSCSLLLVAASSAKAQCGRNTLGYGDVGIVANNPFHAEMVVTRSGPPELPSVPLQSPLVQRPLSVARDTQGRVRIERVGGEFQHDNGPEAGSKVQEHTITICDPVAETLTRINTVNSTATIIHSRPSAPRSSDLQPATPRSFCSSRLPSDRARLHLQVEDLGTQTIEGVEARGERITLPMLGATSGEESPNGESTSELWCSDSLSALVLRISGNTKTGVKSTIAMQKIERTEPDPALFQIPPDYAITESVAEPRDHRTPNPAPNEQP
jgi:hypothetical protein